MIVIKAIEKLYEDIDENGQPVTRTCLEPETPIPAMAIKTEIKPDGNGVLNYHVFELGEL